MAASPFAGRVALITGAASGIGAAVARALGAAGARLALVDVNDAAGRALAEELDALYLHADVSRREDWQQALARCAETLGPPDFAHLNAGVMSVPADQAPPAFEDLPERNLRRIVDVNLLGVAHGLQTLLPLMRGRDGAVCVTASMVGLVPLPLDPMYAATKHALVGLVRSVAATSPAGLRINAICPGGVDTPIVPEALRAAGMALMPVAELAGDVLNLLARGDNGEILLCRGGDVPAVAVPPPELG
ncbi:MAG: SDR family NAD(P)-dependent oxidoreductase [Gammaproteobacteria bacterium]|jgi:NAD(P)-dependent dehydrogenase (short-subunit alcohol dehydrogenase family)|nr:SDR family NAD(P)-dependent oxidoreductase [Gammaproteobacteria bacterium]